ncbi:MAG: hypothetical protein HY913_23800 [Desulfomonile tiedjei]|nr:hypothetical protein [Desulfomonile tiedjei]
MASVSLGPGDDVEAWCTRCRMNLNHRVVAVIGNRVQRVQCLTCGGDHKYYPPKFGTKDEPEKRHLKIAPAEKGRKSVDRVAAKAQSEWSTFMKDMPPDYEPRPYKVSGSYKQAEFIEHPVFGIGRVLDLVGAEKMQVIFKDGRKILICNKSEPR